eukprot:7967216-Karenia_brevis.AAC.1
MEGIFHRRKRVWGLHGPSWSHLEVICNLSWSQPWLSSIPGVRLAQGRLHTGGGWITNHH